MSDTMSSPSHTADELSDALRSAFEWASAAVSQVEVDDLDKPTRCRAWTVRMLVNHMLGAIDGFATGVPKGDVMPWVDVTVDRFQGAPRAAYDAAWPPAIAAWAAADPADSTHMPWADLPNALASQLLILESVVHGSDLLLAIGREATIPDELAQPVLALSEILLADPTNRGDAFEPAVQVPENVSMSDRLVAFLGRVPSS